jgi:hypothetical protein
LEILVFFFFWTGLGFILLVIRDPFTDTEYPLACGSMPGETATQVVPLI